MVYVYRSDFQFTQTCISISCYILEEFLFINHLH